jgi:hypothetical protein
MKNLAKKAKSLEVTMECASRYDLADPSDSEQAKQKAKSLEVTWSDRKCKSFVSSSDFI